MALAKGQVMEKHGLAGADEVFAPYFFEIGDAFLELSHAESLGVCVGERSGSHRQFFWPLPACEGA
jgi:hypothetical protein